MDRKLGVAVCGIGWCGAQHVAAFQRNPHVEITWLCARDAGRARASLSAYGLAVPGARITANYDDVLSAPDVDIIAIAPPRWKCALRPIARRNRAAALSRARSSPCKLQLCGFRHD
jgi:hypothetical protein